MYFERLNDLLKEIEVHPFLSDSNKDINLTDNALYPHFPNDLKITIDTAQRLLDVIFFEKANELMLKATTWLLETNGKYKVDIKLNESTGNLEATLYTPKGKVNFN